MELLADMYKQVYWKVKILNEEKGTIAVEQREVNIIRMQARRDMRIKWQRHLEDDIESGKRIVEAIRPHLEKWLDSGCGTTFHMA